MKAYSKVLALLPVFCGVSWATQAQTLYLWQKDGTPITNSLAEIKSIKFSPNKIHINTVAGTNDYVLADVKYLGFKDMTTGIVDENGKTKNDNTSLINLFPNPAQNILNISFSDNLKEDGLATIYTIEGKVVFKQAIQRDQNTFQFNIGSLDAGMYFCAISAGNQFNTLKFIKQ